MVGANASGKSTVVDGLSFLGDLIRLGVQEAVERRTSNFQDLVWDRPDEALAFQLAVELDVPEDQRRALPPERGFGRFRYEVEIRQEADAPPQIASERGLLMPDVSAPNPYRSLFPDPPPPPETILVGARRRGNRSILSKTADGRATFSIETSHRAGQGWVTNFALGPSRSALGNLPDSPDAFPVASWAREMLSQTLTVFPSSAAMRVPCPPLRRRAHLEVDAANLPWVVMRFRSREEDAYREWLGHVRTVLPDLASIAAVERPEDRHAYLVLEYDSGLKVPSWSASDGTLRLLALTLPAYLEPRAGFYCFEEPENGIHPLALDAVFDSLSSVEDSQVLLATHSPVLLRRARPKEVLCVARTREGATDIVRGDRHPLLRDWQAGAIDTTLLFATGVIG